MKTWAINDGNWSDSSIWNTGNIPTDNDDVYCGGKTITIDQNIEANIISNTYVEELSSIGGKLIVETDALIKSTIQSYCKPVIEYNGTGKLTIIGFITGGDCGEFSSILNKNSGTIEVSGTIRGGNGGYTHGINNLELGTVSVTGFVGMGWGGYSYGIFNTKTGTININNVVSNLSGYYGKEPWEENS